METKERNTITIHLSEDLKQDVKMLALLRKKTLTELVVEVLERETSKNLPNTTIKVYQSRQPVGAGQ